ncbi:hypothetical protein J4G37_25765 [Microvirga sp. 3-52]|nr:hypothetical protein [Microvirga sp. 3-52]
MRSNLMKIYDLRTSGAHSEPAVEMWKDLIDKADAERRKASDGSTNAGPVPGYVFGKEFKDSDTTVIASIYRAYDSACDNGPNSGTSKQFWATCPARVKVVEGGSSRTVEGTVCVTTEGLGLEGKQALQRNNFAVHVPKLGVFFNVTDKGSFVSDCTKEVRYGIFPEQEPEPALIDLEDSSPPPAGAVTAVYSDTQGRTCKQTVREEELSEWTCSAPGGRTVLFGDTGGIMVVRFGEPTNTAWEPEFWPSNNGFGKKIEWRVRDGKPFASILRFFLGNIDGKDAEVLAVTKVEGKDACHMAYVNARLKDANKQAAEIADTKAHAFRCGVHKPIKVGGAKWYGEESFTLDEKAEYFNVTGLQPGQMLPLHRYPPPSSPKVGELPHDAKGLKNFGCNAVDGEKVIPDLGQPTAGLPRFCQIRTSKLSGWVDSRFLVPGSKPPPEPSTDISIYPADIVEAIKPNLEMCETFQLEGDFARNDADLNGDGIKDWIIDYGGLVCDESHIAYSGSAGSLTQMLISSGPGKWVVKFDEYVRDYKVVTRKGKTVISLGMHGSACKKVGAAACTRTVDFNTH